MTDDLPSGQIRFLDNYEPGMDDGTYELTVNQTVSAAGATVPPYSQRLVVAGPRFALDPADVAAQYPPPAASSYFAEVLPHVVFTKRLLPWERILPTGDANIEPDKQTPWLALLCFQPGELLVGEDQDPKTAAIAGYAATMTVSALLELGSSSVRVPDVQTDTTDEASMSCQVITISNTTFATLVPTRRELRFLAHGREVDPAGKVLAGMQNPGEYSVVVCNRFPMPGTETVGAPCVVHLVSLEGFGDLLNGAAPETPSQGTVKLVSLFTWSFSTLEERAQTFEGLVKNLAFDGDTPRAAASLLIGLPFTASTGTDPATKTVNQRLSDGYVALGYHARTGEDAFAWYRGPLIPSVTNPQFAPGTFQTSDAAIIFDPSTGVFDQSLAAAWQCGRSLALADQAYAEALMRLRQAVRTQIHRLTVGNADLPGGIGDAHVALASLFREGAIDLIQAASRGAALACEALARGPRWHRADRQIPAPIHRLRSLMARTEVRSAVQDSLATDPDAIAVAQWLGQLILLEGIPFSHLIPDERMLPPESLRFFYLDQGWISTLIDGALAIGLGTSEESSVQDLLSVQLMEMAAQSALAARANALGQPVPAPASGPLAGVVICSALVSGWPGTVIAGTAAGTAVPLLRFDIVQPNVMIAIFNGVPDQVTIEEPHEGLAFGVDEAGQIETRTVSNSVVTNVKLVQIYNPDAPTTPFPSLRAAGLRVLNVNSDPAYPTTSVPTTPVDLLGLVAQGLGEGTGSLAPGDFALQMIQGPELLTIKPV
jgi:hypothetical protein